MGWPIVKSTTYSETLLELSGVSGLVSSTASLKTGDAVGISVLKKAMDLERANALALLEALPPVPASSQSRLGGAIDTFA